MTKKTKLRLFLLIFAVLLLLPLVLMLTSGKVGLVTVRDISVALGFIGLTLAGMQFLPISRMPWLADAIHLDKMYKLHHVTSVLSVLLVASHAAVLLLGAQPLSRSGWTLNAGWIGLGAFGLIALTSILRKKIKLGYTAWLLLHDVFTVAILVFGLLHMYRVNYYMRFPSMKLAWILLIVVWAGAGLYMRLLRPLLLGRKPWMVDKVLPESADTFSVYLKPDGHAGTPFKAGQVAWISTGKSPFVISRNPFSYSGSTAWDALRFSIKKAGDFTNTIPDLKPGDRMFVDGPYGTFNLANPRMQKGLVLLGGGIGIAPTMSIVNTLADMGDQRPVYVFYGDMCEHTFLFEEEFAALKSRMNLTLVKVLEKPNVPEACDHIGYITRDLLQQYLPENYKELYYFMCGPLPMMNAMANTLAALEVDPKQITTEKYEMA